MLLATILILVLVVVLILAVFNRGSPRLASYGWYPSGGIGLIVLILVVLLLLGRL